jgi:succinoglycan biosynthesis protein ExoM
MRILITICTRNRPKLLETCLRSVAASRVPTGVECAIAVIENNDRITASELVERVARETGWMMFVVLEPELGLPFARNRCGITAVERGYDWLLYIDDDEEATPGWLETMIAAARRNEADVHYGRVISVYPPGTPDWMALPEPNKRETGARLAKAEGHNTLVKTRIFAPDGLNLRFDESLRFTGGSDTDFFTRVHKAGGTIRWLGDAVVRENVPATRMTLRWQLRRAFRVAISIAVVHEKEGGKGKAIWRSLVKGAGRLSGGLLMMIPALPAMLLGTAGKTFAFRQAKQVASGLGSFAYILGIRPQPYRKMDGA